MIVVQIFIGFCFGISVAFFFGLGCHGVTRSFRMSYRKVQGDLSGTDDDMLRYLVVGLIAFGVSGALAVAAVAAVRAAA